MANVEILRFAREVGPDKFKELRTLKKAVSFVRNPQNAHALTDAEAKIELTLEQIRAIQEMLIKPYLRYIPELRTAGKAIEDSCPGFFRPGNKVKLSVKTQKIDDKSGVVEIKGKDAFGTTNLNLKATTNKSGGKISINGTSEVETSKLEATYLNDERPVFEQLIKGIDATISDGTAKLTLPETKTGGLTVSADINAKEDYMNALTQISTLGAVKSYRDALKMLTQLG